MTMITPEQRLADLAQQRAERKDIEDLPRSMTPRELNAYVTATAQLDQQIRAIHAAVAAMSFPTFDTDVKWLRHLNKWQATLEAELLALPLRVKKNEEHMDRRNHLNWCIGLINRGLGHAPYSMPIVDLSSTRIGELMAAEGYETQGEGLRGPRGWRGSLPEVEARLKLLTEMKEKAQTALDHLLVPDDERMQQEAAAQAYHAALRTMRITNNATGNGHVAFTLDDEPLPREQMSASQREAFDAYERMCFPPAESESASSPQMADV